MLSYDETFLDIKIAFLMITLIMTLLGNSMVLMAIYYDSRLRTAINFFVACLATSDIAVALLSVTIRLFTLFSEKLRLRKSLVTMTLCRFWIWIDIFCEAASIFTLTVISIERYFKICRPYVYCERMTKRLAIYVIVFVWIIAALLASLAMLPFGDKGIIIDRNQCYNYNKIFYTIAPVVAFFLPLLILIVMYAMIFRIAILHFKKSNRVLMRDPTSSHYSVYKDLKATKTLFIVVSTFIVCWGPFLYFSNIPIWIPIHDPLGKTLKYLKTVIVIILPYANSFFNPIIYACFDKSYQRAFRKILQKTFCHKYHGLGPKNVNKTEMKESDENERKFNLPLYEFKSVQRKRYNRRNLHRADL
ncbi:beta-1 adrenergic receptor-like [Xenia sp. Carnegie-2017]|uniref:beta-1 adrenergic receptor-like n=1 Tax=Xenia sp. Carnegie-2017 TaxID=2897299 RepID=UPI001F034D6E|nr:beta-1 adrenergic receptor-like [Xenia sp. Carnegie-2017]